MNTLNNQTTQNIIEQIAAEQLDSIISEGEFNIIDVRNPEDIEKQGHIPGAINIPFHAVEQAIDGRDEDYNSIFDMEGKFLFSCTGGVMSYVAALKAQENGIRKVFNLEGGHMAWIGLKQSQNSY